MKDVLAEVPVFGIMVEVPVIVVVDLILDPVVALEVFADTLVEAAAVDVDAEALTVAGAGDGVAADELGLEVAEEEVGDAAGLVVEDAEERLAEVMEEVFTALATFWLEYVL